MLQKLKIGHSEILSNILKEGEKNQFWIESKNKKLRARGDKKLRMKVLSQPEHSCWDMIIKCSQLRRWNPKWHNLNKRKKPLYFWKHICLPRHLGLSLDKHVSLFIAYQILNWLD